MKGLAALLAVAAGMAVPPAAAELPQAQRQRIDALFAEFARPGSPGCALAVLDQGRIAYQRGYGLASLEHGVAIDPARTVFDIGSTSKQFTAASILLLAQDGKLALDDDIRDHIPELPDYGHHISLDHLLRHTSGIPDYIALMMLAGSREEDHTTGEDALRAIARVPVLGFAPGAEYSYSNSGYFLLSLVVERVGGKPLREFARERIFEPLAMRDTMILDDHAAVIPHKAASYEPRGGNGYRAVMSNWEQNGDGAVQTTLGDLAKWDENFYHGKVGGPALLAQLQETGVLNDGKPIAYARGLMVDGWRGQKRVRHGGAWAGFRSELVRFPDRHASVVVLCNYGDADPGALADKVAELHLGDALAAGVPGPAGAPQPHPVAGRALSALAGLYVDTEQGRVLDLVEDGGKLWALGSRGDRTELTPLGGDRFDLRGTQLQFAGEDGATPGVSFDMAGRQARLGRRTPVRPGPEALAAYAGRYYSRELETTWTLREEGGRLLVRGARGAEIPLAPTFADAFRGNGALLLFQRDERGQVRGFDLAVSRVRGLRFARGGLIRRGRAAAARRAGRPRSSARTGRRRGAGRRRPAGPGPRG